MTITFQLPNFSYEVFIKTLLTGENEFISGTVCGGSWKDPDFDSWMTYKVGPKAVKINTALSGYTYTIFPDGRVMYNGPYMGLLEQSILPSILKNAKFTGFELVESSMFTGILKRYWELRAIHPSNADRYKQHAHPYCLKIQPGETPVWHEALR